MLESDLPKLLTGMENVLWIVPPSTMMAAICHKVVEVSSSPC